MSVVGANSLGIIISQLLIYYQAVPILCTQHEENLNIAKESGIYYVLGSEDNWQKEVVSITGGRMCKQVIYIANSDIPIIKAFSLASYGAKIAYTGVAFKNNAFSFNQAIKKQLNIICLSNGYENTETAINLLANNAVDISHLKLKNYKENEVVEVLSKMNEDLSKNGFANEIIIDIM